jgi:hypothetical protein
MPAEVTRGFLAEIEDIAGARPDARPSAGTFHSINGWSGFMGSLDLKIGRALGP